MNDYRKYAMARNQLYHLVVQLRQVDASISKNHRTKEFQNCLDTVVRLVHEALAAFENGEVMAVQIDRYAQTELPGFEDQFPEMKNPYKGDRD